MKKAIFFMTSLLVMAGCGQTAQSPKTPALDLSNLDSTVAPGTDFYQYATGGWQKNHPLKPEYARYGTFDALRDSSEERLNRLFKSMENMQAEAGSTEEKIVILYKQGLDSVTLNKEGAEPVKKYVDEIYAVSDKDGLVKELAKLHDVGEGGFFGAYVGADLANSNMQILYFGQSGLGIGDRDYYIDPANAALKEGYKNMLTKLFSLAGNENPEQAAANALAVEDVIARYSWTKVQERDIQAQYNPMSTAELEKNYPGFNFKAYLAERNIPDQDKLVVGELSYFKGLTEYFAKADLQQLKDYLAGQLLTGGCGALHTSISSAGR